MKSTKNLAAAVVICILFMAPLAFADIVVFKTGKELKVEKTWLEGEQICFLFHGVKAGIPQSKIIRIKSDANERNKTFPLGNKSKSDLKSVRPDQREDTARMVLNSSGSATTTEACPGLRKNGFCDLQWGRKVSSVDGLEKKQTISDLNDVIEYVRPRDILKIGDTQLKSITYAFWQDQLYTVTIWTEGYPNYTALRDKVFKEFGPGRQTASSSERYLWSDTLSDIMLEYIEDGQYGMLWLRSKELDRQCKSSQLKVHATYLKWMKSRN